ncbi:GTPase HflX [Bradymonas sediminis]|uniref:GTPase HflX n=1 Tax=Bradymonas sediminis TaxID=1548548 RepID=UPI0010E3D5E6|nr:GTPase HflX [Bradymonas sediminis]TDP62609.1 GTP-binding protein HflX [Bradymonas sediminis]
MSGLKSSQQRALEKLYRHQVNSAAPVTQGFANRLTEISGEINRVVAVLVDRAGQVDAVVVGDAKRVYLPDIGRQRAAQDRFRGIRLIRTYLESGGHGVELTNDDLTDLSKLQLDMVMSIAVGHHGEASYTKWAHLLPQNPEERAWEIHSEERPHDCFFDFAEFIRELEGEFERKTSSLLKTGQDPALLVYVATPGGRDEEIELAELLELARTAGVEIVDTMVQRRTQVHPKYAVGKGKIEELTLRALQLDCDLVIFAQDLTPGQLRAITDATELKVIDRTQLILDIFAQRAKSRDGKVQVELAQLKYSLPRLHSKSTGMSRLAGGIGGRGPGETKLEINRRRAHDKIGELEREIVKIGEQRELRRKRRQKSDIPIVSVVGYTNAGKSTLLNGLTQSSVLMEDKLFATLRPTSRRLRYGNGPEMILTDTVGFIHELPEELVSAFKATLEELGEADLLIHLVDISNENFEARMDAVNRILKDIDLGDKEQVLVFNKVDLLKPKVVKALCRRFDAVPISALDLETTHVLIEKLASRLFSQRRAQASGRDATVDPELYD